MSGGPDENHMCCSFYCETKEDGEGRVKRRLVIGCGPLLTGSLQIKKEKKTARDISRHGWSTCCTQQTRCSSQTPGCCWIYLLLAWRQSVSLVMKTCCFQSLSLTVSHGIDSSAAPGARLRPSVSLNLQPFNASLARNLCSGTGSERPSSVAPYGWSGFQGRGGSSWDWFSPKQVLLFQRVSSF